MLETRKLIRISVYRVVMRYIEKLIDATLWHEMKIRSHKDMKKSIFKIVFV